MVKVKFEWDFEFDDDGLSEEYVDIQGLAKDMALKELTTLIKDGGITSEDFQSI